MTTAFQSMPAPSVVYNATGIVVGRIERARDGRVWLVKGPLDRASHQLQRPLAWATDCAHLVELRKLGGHGVRLFERDGTRWEATLEDFERHGIAFDRGFGPQVALALKHWRVQRPGARQLALLPVAS